MNIAIFMQNRPHFGATLLHIPLIYSLKQCYPDAEIALFSKNSSAKMLFGVTDVKQIHVTQNKVEEVKLYKQFNADMSISLRKNSLPAALAILFFNRLASFSYANFISKAFFTKAILFNQHQFRAESFLSLLPDTCHKHYLPKLPSEQKNIYLMPGGAFEWKHWEIKNYLQLADRLQERFTDHTICFIMGEMEKHYLPIIEAWSQRYKVYMNATLPKLFTLVRSAQLVIANDCGPSHIAQISEVPNIILYSSETNDGYNVAKEWFRKKEGSYYLVGEKDQSINSISVNSVYVAVEKSLKTKEVK